MTSPIFLPLQAILVALDFAIFLLTFGWVKWLMNLGSGGMRSVPVPDGDGPSHRWSKWSDDNGKLAVSPFDGVTTIYELTARAFREFGDKPCMGTRVFVEMKSEKPPVKLFEDPVYATYAEVDEKVRGREAPPPLVRRVITIVPLSHHNCVHTHTLTHTLPPRAPFRCPASAPPS